MKTVNPIVFALRRADDAYHNKKAIMSDAHYDIIYAAAQKVWPKDEYFTSVGAPVPIGQKVKLSAPMPGLPQWRPNEAIEWLTKSKKPYVVMAKPDGIACQLTYSKGKLILGATRGDGVEGRDITAHVKNIVGVWPTISDKWKKKTIIVRGEVTMHRSVFKELNLDKYANTRTLCNAMLNSKESNAAILSKMVFIAFDWQVAGEYLTSKSAQLSMIAAENFISINSCGPVNYDNYKWLQDKMQMRFIPQKAFKPFRHSYHDTPVTKAWILSTLDFLRKEFDLDLDGLVITLNEIQNKAKVYSYKIKPDRVDQEHARGVVQKVVYNLSARSLMIPVAVMKTPIMFNGTEVKRATLNNFAQVKKMQIGPGSVIDMVKAGDVIPYLDKVIKPVGYERPRNCPSCNAKLKFNGTHLLCDNPKCIGANLPLMINFFAKLKVDAIGPGTLEKFANAGYNSVAKVLSMSPKTMASLDRIGEKNAAKVIAGIKKMISKWHIHEFMAASGIFASDKTSLGSSLLEIICEKFSISDMRGNLKPYQLTALPKIGQDRAELFIDSLPDFIRFYDAVRAVIKLEFQEAVQGGLSGMQFVFTNFRSEDMETKIKALGGKIGSSVTMSTNALFYTGSSTKTANAQKLKDRGVDIKIIPQEKAAAWLDKLIATL